MFITSKYVCCRASVAYVFGVICSQVRSSGSSCVQFRLYLSPSEIAGDDGNDGEDGEGGDVGPEDEPSTAARVATEIRAAVKGRRAE